MWNRSLIVSGVTLIVLAACASTTRTSTTCPVGGAPGMAGGPRGAGCCVAPGCHLGASGATKSSTATIDQRTREALARALDDERRAQAYYGAVIGAFGQVRPFAQIIHAEGRHEAHVLALMKTYNVEAPPNSWAGRTFDLPATLGAAAAQAVQFERENVAMYDGFLEFVPAGDIRDTMAQLRRVSLERHIPAFEATAKQAS